jgi:DNA invertase Pin-like site-specific DNA recombinase
MLVGYARTFQQDERTTGQIEALRAAGCERIVEEAGCDTGRERPRLVAALEDMREGDTLVVWRLDRLAVSLHQLVDTVAMLQARGLGLRSLNDPVDTTGDAGRLVAEIFVALAAFERTVVRERTVAGLTAARERGRVGGRPPALTEEDVAAAKVLLSQPDITAREVARRLGVSVSTLYKHIPAARTAAFRDESG